MTNKKPPPLTYSAAGVDIDKGDAFIEAIKPYAERTMRPEVISGIGGFASLCALPKGYKNPILVSATDGIGTKLKFGLEVERLATLGIDLVAMCVNDVLTIGAEPLFFLDYYATSKLNIQDGRQLVKGIAKGCELAGCVLIGGETAEMPGIYAGRDFDLAGFSVGVVDRKKILDGKNIKVGDVLIAIGSSGPHANGYSLIRKILAQTPNWQTSKLAGKNVADLLIEPTRIYTNAIKTLMATLKVKALAHITGGGLIGNVPRILPKHLTAEVLADSWDIPPIFCWLQANGNVAEAEMQKVFNLGIGMVAVVSAKNAQRALESLINCGESAWIIGEIALRDKGAASFQML